MLMVEREQLRRSLLTGLFNKKSLSIFALSLGVLGMVWVERYRELIALLL